MITPFRQFTHNHMLSEESEETVDSQAEFNNILAAVSGYLQVKFPVYKMPFDSLTICRVVDSVDKISDSKQTKKQITIVDPRVKTMAVDGLGNVFINQDFMFEMWSKRKKYVVGIIIHEIMHIVYQHMLRYHKLPSVYDALAHHPSTDPKIVPKLPREPSHKAWNFATDYVINWYIREMEGLNDLISLPPDGLHAEPGTGRIPLDTLTADVYILDDAGKMRTPESIYVQLLRAGFERYDEQPDGQKGQGGEEGEAQDGQGQGGGQGATSDEINRADSKRFDDHVTDKSLADKITKQGGTPNQLSRDDWDLVVKQSQEVAKQMDSQRSSGKIGGSYGVEIGHASADWKSILKKFMSVQLSSPSASDWSRPRKRPVGAGVYLPRSKQVEQRSIPEILVAIDTSGSTVGDQPRFLSELLNLIKVTKNNVRVLLWDDVVGDDITFQNVNGRVMWGKTGEKATNQINPDRPFKVTGGGGTTASCVAEYLAQQKPVVVPKVVIYLTDGYIESNPKLIPRAATLVVLTPGGTSAEFEGKPNTTIVNMQ